MFENVDGRTDDGVTGILIAHLGAFGSGELIKVNKQFRNALSVHVSYKSKQGCKDQESIQPSTTPDII